ncbi:unnamed protein product [Cochlearia groenlandica]
MEDVLSRAWAQIKWEEDPSQGRPLLSKFDSRIVRSEKAPRDNKPYTRPRVDSHRDNPHQPITYRPRTSHRGLRRSQIGGERSTQKGHMKEFLSERARNRSNFQGDRREDAGEKHDYPPRQDRVIIVIYGGSDQWDITFGGQKKYEDRKEPSGAHNGNSHRPTSLCDQLHTRGK